MARPDVVRYQRRELSLLRRRDGNEECNLERNAH